LALTQLGFNPEVLLQHGLRKAYFGRFLPTAQLG